MDIPHIVLLVIFAIIIALNVLDYLSTQRFLKAGTGTEANPVMAYLQRKLGSYWWVAKLVFIPIMAVLWFGLAPYSVFAAVGISGALALFYFMTVMSNYAIN